MIAFPPQVIVEITWFKLSVTVEIGVHHCVTADNHSGVIETLIMSVKGFRWQLSDPPLKQSSYFL